MPAPKRKKTLISDSESEGSASEGEEDLDKELLNISKKKKPNSKAESEKSSSESETSSGSDDEWTGKAGKKKVKKKKKRASPPPNKADDSSSEEEAGNNSEPEEGEVNESGSEKSGNDSDSDAGSDKSEEFNDGYDENLMGDEEDRRRLEQMTEKEREQELFNRIEQREVLKTRFEIERKLKKAKEKEQKMKAKKEGKKEKSSSSSSSPVRAAVDASNQRVKEVEARRGASTKMQKLNELRQQREKKKQDQDDREKQRREEEEKKAEAKSSKKKKTKLQANDVFSSSDESDKAEDKSGSGSDDDAASKKSASPKRRSRSRSSSSSSSSSGSSKSGSKSRSRSRSSGSGSDNEVARENSKPKTITCKEELGRIRISRFKLERWVHAPFFADTVLNCFVRVNIGTNDGQAIYRVTEVVGVKETQKVYDFGSSKTNKALRLRYAKAERDYRLEYISNSDFTEKEYSKWIEAMTLADLPLPTLKEVEKKQRAIKEALAFKFNDDSISKMVEEKEKFRKNPINYAMRKTRLQKMLEMAQTNSDDAEIEKLKTQLDELEERAAELDRQRTKNISSVTYINERNRTNNIKVVENAMVKEFRIQKQMAADPFMRKNTAPTMVTMAKDQDGKVMKDHLFQFLEERYSSERPKWVREKEAAAAAKAAAAASASFSTDSPLKDNEGPRVNSTGGGGSRNEDLFSCHDFDVNIDLNVPSSLPNSTPSNEPRLGPNLTPGGSSGPKRTLNLEDYKRKKGLI